VSSLWTPEGEHRVPPAAPAPPTGPSAAARSPAAGRTTPTDGPAEGHEASARERADEARRLEELRQELARVPAADVVANHCYGLFELAALHLSTRPPKLAEARLAIDALGALVDGLGDRLGEHASPLRDGLAQIRLAYVQIAAAEGASPGAGDARGAPA
jgi:hypothetical protein